MAVAAVPAGGTGTGSGTGLTTEQATKVANTPENTIEALAFKAPLSLTGALNLLNTTDKTSLVNSINEIFAALAGFGNLSNTDIDTLAELNAILGGEDLANKTFVSGLTGILSGLATADKANIVSSINELVQRFVVNESDIASKLNTADLPSSDLSLGTATVSVGVLDITNLDIATLTLSANTTITGITGLKVGGIILNVVPNGFTLSWAETIINPLNISGDVFDVSENMTANIICTSTSPLRFAIHYEVNYAPVLPVPNAPSVLTASAVNSGRIDLAWADNSSDETGFEIERSLNGTTFTLLEAVGAGETTYQDITVSQTTLYYYRVRATNANGSSTYSNIANATTPVAETVWFEVNLGANSDPAIANNLSGRLAGSIVSNLTNNVGGSSTYIAEITTAFASIYSGGVSPTYITGSNSGDVSDLSLGSGLGQNDGAAVIRLSGLPVGQNLEIQVISSHINSAARTMFGKNGGTQQEVNSYQNIIYNSLGTAIADASGYVTIQVNRKAGVSPVGIINALRFRTV